MSTHLDLDGLADLLVGEGQEDQVAHLTTCPRCSAALTELDEAQESVRRALAGLPEPEVPADLPARLDAALLAAHDEELPAARSVPEGGGRASDQPSGRAAAAARVIPQPGRRSRSHRPVLLAGAVAAVAVLAVGAGLLLSRTGAGTTSTASSAVPSSGAAGAAGAALGQVPTSATGTDYGPGRSAVAAQLPRLLRAAPAAGPQSAPARTPDPLARLHDPAELAGCLSALGGTPIALDYARFHGSPALLVVLPAADPARLDVYVVGPGCRAGADDTELFTQVARAS